MKTAAHRQLPMHNRSRFGALRDWQSLSSTAATSAGTSQGRHWQKRLASNHSRIGLPTLDQFSRRGNMHAKKAMDAAFRPRTEERLFEIDMFVSRSPLPRIRIGLFTNSHAATVAPELGALCFSAGARFLPATTGVRPSQRLDLLRTVAWVTKLLGGTSSVSQTLPPIVDPFPMTIRPRMVAPA
jgi:hypothetical protein